MVTGNEYSGKNREETIIHSASGGAYDGAGEKRLPVVVTDDESSPTITLGLTETNGMKLDSVEEGSQKQFRVTAILHGPTRQMDTDLTLVFPDEDSSRFGRPMSSQQHKRSWRGIDSVGWTLIADVAQTTFSETPEASLSP